MRILFINQAFYPDVVSSGQHLTDIALQLAERGHKVTVVTSRRTYDNPTTTFPGNATWRGIKIKRVFNTGFGKRNKWTRALDFGTFIVFCCLRLVWLPKQDLVVGMTSPPLVAVIAAAFARLHRSKFVYWVMDLNPDEALAAGWLRPHSFIAAILERLSLFSLKSAAKAIALDRFMEYRILRKGIHRDKIEVIPPWSHDSQVDFDPQGRSEFRKAYALEDKFVVMHCGNHSPCHPLDTVLQAAKQLAGNSQIAFCFVGGGSEFVRVKRFAQEERLMNIVCLPYQPLSRLSAALSAADLHVTIMGDPFVGLVHPCKVYNILLIGTPLLYIGPTPSHVSELIQTMNNGRACALIRHGDVNGIIRTILELKKSSAAHAPEPRTARPNHFAKSSLLPRLVSVLERAAVDTQEHGLPGLAPASTGAKY